jgi:tetratricopeptide (TPR) repeat protein
MTTSMTRMISRFGSAVVVMMLGAVAAAAQTSAGAMILPGMGDYTHPIRTTNAEAQQYFDQGLALLYNFNHAEAERSFLEAAELDPKAPMPWWGVGIALGLNYNRDVTKLEGERLQRAHDAAQKAVALSRGGSPIEAALADALATRYSLDPAADPDALNHRYREAMKQAHERFPDDLEIATMYADAVMNLRPWELWKPDGTPQPDTPELLAVLQDVLRRNPTHVGANHYFIHAVEASPTPELGLASAARLETLVPGAGHLLHMPTHIYMHTGELNRIAAINERAARADETYFEVARPEGFYPFMYYGHNVHFAMVGYLLTGRYADARAQAVKMADLARPHVEDMAAMAEWAVALPVLVDVRFHRWEAILASPQPPATQTLNYAFDAYGRALALHMTGRTADARSAAETFEAARAKVGDDLLVNAFNTGPAVLAAFSHLLRGQMAPTADQALPHLESAVAAQDAFHYDEPAPIPWSLRETLGALLLDAGRAADAEKVFRDDLARNPRSGRSLFGLWKSLEAQNRPDEARIVQAEFEQAWGQATEGLSVKTLY